MAGRPCRTARALRRRLHSDRALTAAAIVLLLAGCQCQRRDRDVAPTSSTTALAPQPDVPDLASSAVAPPASRFAQDPLWQRCGSGDPLDLELLAQREGATGLLEGTAIGGQTAATALAALPFAPDGEIAMVQLCEWLRGISAEAAAGLLTAIHGVAGRPPQDVEQLEPTWVATCASALEQFAARPGVSAQDHDLAVSARQLIDEHRLGK